MRLSPNRFLRILLCGCCAPALAQPGAGSADRTMPAEDAPTAHEARLANLVRLFQPADPSVALTGRERFREYSVAVAGPMAIVRGAAAAGLGQTLDSPHEWGQGAAGYGLRLGNNLAYNAVRATITSGTAALLHEDNRYFASGRLGVWPRTWYALASPVLAHRHGRRVFSISEMTGVAGASALSRTWAPPSWQGGRNIAVSAAISLAGVAGFNLFREFVPDILKRWKRQ